MTNAKWEEIILVSPRASVFENEALTFQGVEKRSNIVEQIMKNVSESFGAMRRGAIGDPTDKLFNAEVNADFKQPIPYAIIKRGNEVFVYKRLTGGGETRLHDQYSIGVGGHMNPIEGISDFKALVDENLERELVEELEIVSTKKKTKFIGLINDDVNEVGRVHLGILVVIELDENATVEVREKEQLEGFWASTDSLRANYELLESWSQIAANVLID